MYKEFVEFFGIIVVMYFVFVILIMNILWPLFHYIWVHFLQNQQKHRQKYLPTSVIDVNDNVNKYWAIVTGGTDGIGLSYCHHLAELGYQLFIISRSMDKLKSTKQQIQEKLSGEKCPEIRLYQFDFNENFQSKLYDQLEIEIKKLENIYILVNNVGKASDLFDYFNNITKTEPGYNQSLINVNICSLLRMTSICLPLMINAGKGVIINLSSLSALSPLPLMSSYSASKAFIDYFSRSLQLELKDRYPDIIIQTILPGFVSTKMINMRPSFFVPTSDSFVKSSLKTIGHFNRTCVYYAHCIQHLSFRLSKYSFIDLYTPISFKILLNHRRYLMKQLNEQNSK